MAGLLQIQHKPCIDLMNIVTRYVQTRTNCISKIGSMTSTRNLYVTRASLFGEGAGGQRSCNKPVSNLSIKLCVNNSNPPYPAQTLCTTSTALTYCKLGYRCRSFHTSISKHAASLPKDTDVVTDFKEVIYRHPHMQLIRFVNSLKMFQTFIAVTYVPWAFYVNSLNQMSDWALYAQSGLTVFALVMLYAMSSYIRRLAGVIAINEAEDQLKISHLTFWGRRQDDIIDIHDVVPFGEDGERWSERFKKIILSQSSPNSDKFYYVDLRGGDFKNSEKFEDVFGSILRQ